MLRPRDQSLLADDPVVRRTVGKLRVSLAAVVIGVVLCMATGWFVAQRAYSDGFSTSRTPASQPVAVAKPAVATRPKTKAARRAATRRANQQRAAKVAAAKAAQQAPTVVVGGPRPTTFVLLFG